MNAQHIIGQLSDKIFHSDFNNNENMMDSNTNLTEGISELISVSMENDVPPTLISNEALDKPMLDIVNRLTYSMPLMNTSLTTWVFRHRRERRYPI